MKKNMKKFLHRNKKILMIMGVTLTLFVSFACLVFILFIRHDEQIQSFLETGEMSSVLVPITTFSLVFICLGFFFFGLFTLFIIKLFFPHTKSFSQLFMSKERAFLKELPSTLRREVFKDE